MEALAEAHKEKRKRQQASQARKKQGSTSQKPLEEQKATEKTNDIPETRKAVEGVIVVLEQENRRLTEARVEIWNEEEHLKAQVQEEVVREEIPPRAAQQLRVEETGEERLHSMATLAKKIPFFVGKQSDDVDLHVRRFEQYWKVARPRDPNIEAAALEELKKDSFLNTFQKKAIEWISRYEDNHYNTYAPLVTAFLQRFRKEKSSSQICVRIREMRQEDMDVEAYASKVLSMRQRVEEQLRPSVKQIAEWFIRGLKPECHAAVNTKNVETQEDFDELIEEAKMAKRRASERTKRRAKKKKSSFDEESSSSSSERTESDTDDQKKKHKKRNKLKKNDVLGEMQALVKELKKTRKGKDF